MQTFLPYSSFVQSARCLDDKRLGKQRVEVLQILKALTIGPRSGSKRTPWYNHPCTQMWRGNEQALIDYGVAVCQEWRKRGHLDTCLYKIIEYVPVFPQAEWSPKWLCNEEFHASHRSALLHKNFKHYSQFNWKETPALNYVWPTANLGATSEAKWGE